MALYRLGIAMLILTPFFVYNWKRNKHAPLTWAILIFPIVGGIMTAMDHTIWSSAMSYTSAANATVLNYAAPVWVALFAWFVFKERLPGLFWLGLVLTLAGVAIVFRQ